MGRPLASVPAEARHHPGLLANVISAVEELNAACVARAKKQWVDCGSYERNLECQVHTATGGVLIAVDPLERARAAVFELQSFLIKAHTATVQHEVTGAALAAEVKEAGVPSSDSNHTSLCNPCGFALSC